MFPGISCLLVLACLLVNVLGDSSYENCEPVSEECTVENGCEIPDGPDENCKLCDRASIGTLVPVVGDCTKFCYCQYFSNQGKNHIENCPGGLHFNPKLQVCDWPLNAGCVYA